LIATDGGLVSIETDPNDVIVDIISFIFLSMLHFRFLKQLSEESKTVDGIQSDIPAIKEYASDLQTFLGSKAIEEEVKKEEKYIMALSESESLFELASV
jgi:hypothetical protein